MQSTSALIPLESPLAAVSPATAALIQDSIAPATQRAYEDALRRYSDFLQGRAPNDALLADHLQALYSPPEQPEDGLAPSSVEMVLKAVRFLEKWHGRPSTVGPLATRAMAGIRRKPPRGRGQVAALRGREVERMVAVVELSGSLAGMRDAAMFRLMSDCLLRISELIAVDYEHVQFADDGTGLLTIPRSKTDPEGKGKIMAFGPPTADALRRLIQAAEITDGPLFHRIRKGDLRPELPQRMWPSGVRHIIQRTAARIGVEGASGHSFRIGTAQDLAQSGASLVEMQNAGRWNSPDMPAHYSREQAARQGAVLKYRYGL